ncbi:hypothetical protein I543_2145 [Mycobacteroides abscessus 21]|uniref:Uncharacterized protein n=1 Tax=Mycobacteroides abscessus 21 TaxID=1299324 RepID=A0A829QAD0_9MYCO|nr:hypothetical protein I543_2145 [Mycobacteroides abscessus 21]
MQLEQKATSRQEHRLSRIADISDGIGASARRQRRAAAG